MVHEGTLYDLAMGLDYSVALELSLYFFTWRDMIEWGAAEWPQGLRDRPAQLRSQASPQAPVGAAGLIRPAQLGALEPDLQTGHQVSRTHTPRADPPGISQRQRAIQLGDRFCRRPGFPTGVEGQGRETREHAGA